VFRRGNVRAQMPLPNDMSARLAPKTSDCNAVALAIRADQP
jgi:hypothetical protein